MSNDEERLQAAVSDRYEVIRELGHGGMATVFLARDVKHDRPVAIKVLEPEIALAVGAERFQREIRIASRLQHPQILDLYDSGSFEGLHYYVMPYVEGRSLRERLDQEAELPADEALRITAEVADALAYAHEQGVVHRDIKPENILLSGEHPVIADFGIARAISEASDDRLTASGFTVGTPAYMSPEQAGGEQLDGRTDIYSLACVLYEMLSGEPPFVGPNVQAVITGHMVQQPRPVRSLRPDVPSTISDAIDTALAKTPAERQATAVDFKRELALPIRERVLDSRRTLIAVLLGVPAVATAVLLAALLLMPGLRRPDLDTNRVVVFPPIDRREESASAEAGLDVAFTIEAALDHAHPLRWDDGWDRLEDPVRRDPLLLTAGLANEIGRDRGAAYYIDGFIGTQDDSAVVTLRLHDVEGDSLLAVERSAADSAGVVIAALALQAVTGLLPELVDPGMEIDLSALTDRDPGAIALWIQGEREYRLFHFSGALDLYRRALAEDSLLVFAAIKGAQAAGWELHYAEVEDLIDVAVSHDTLLPERYGHLAHGIRAYSTGQPDTAIRRLEAALDLDPHWSEAAAALGETYYHLIPAKGNPVALAEGMFTRALIPDTAFSPPLLHLAEIAIRKAEVDRAGRLLQALANVQPDSSYYRHALLMLDCVESGADEMAWEEAAANEPLAALAAAYELAVAASDVQCAKSGFRAILVQSGFPSYNRETAGTQWSAVLGLQGLLVAEGRHGEAVALLDSAVSGGLSQAYSLYVIDFLAGAPMELEAQKVKSIVISAFGDDYARAGPQLRWLMGAWHAWHGEVEKAAQISADLDSMAEKSGDPRQRLLAEALASHLSLARGDTTDAIERLRALRPNATRIDLIWGLAESLAVERLLLAELLLARGEHQEAHDVAAVFDHPAPYIYLPFLTPSLIIRLEAAESMGRGDMADLYRRRLQSLGRLPA